MARERGGARRARRRRDRRASGSPARCTASSRSTRRTGCAAGDPLERPAHGGGVRRDRGADRARAADRADREPGAHRASPRRSSSGSASTSRTPTRRIRRILLPKDYVRLRLTGEHAIDVADASGTLLLDVAAPALERRGARRARDPAAWLPQVLESPAVVRASTRGRRPGRGRRRGLRRRRRSASASTGPGPVSVVLGTSGVVFAALPAYRARRPRRASHVFCHAVPGAWHAMGVMLSAAGSLAVAARAARAGASVRRARRRGRAPGSRAPRGSCSCRTCRASGRRTPIRTRAARSSGLQLRHDRGALVRAVLEGVAFGLRDSLDLVRALGVDTRARRASGGGARGGSGCGSSPRCSTCRSSGPVDEGSAFGAALLGGVAGGVFADVARPSGAASARRPRRARPGVARRVRRAACPLRGPLPGSAPLLAASPGPGA